jgi:hypothetical protein
MNMMRSASVARALLGRAGELGQREHGHAQLLRERLEAARDLRHLLLSALRVRRALHELQIVDDDHVEPLLRLEPARLGTHLEQSDASSVVDPDRRMGKNAGGACKPRKIVVA